MKIEKRKVFGYLLAIVFLFMINFISAALDIGQMLNYWAEIGVFTYILPFLLIFALVFGILQKSNLLGDNKAVIIMIALACGLLALVGGAVPRFFEGIFPYTGIALSILLAGIILIGLFFTGEDDMISKVIMWVLFGIGIIAFIVITYTSLADYNITTGNFWHEYGPSIFTLLIIAGIITLISITAGKNKVPKPPK